MIKSSLLFLIIQRRPAAPRDDMDDTISQSLFVIVLVAGEYCGHLVPRKQGLQPVPGFRMPIEAVRPVMPFSWVGIQRMMKEHERVPLPGVREHSFEPLVLLADDPLLLIGDRGIENDEQRVPCVE